MLETQTMKYRSNDSGVSQRPIFWFAIALALTVAVSGFSRSAVAQQPAPQPSSRAQQSANDAASRRPDLIGDEKLFQAEPKVSSPYALTYSNAKGIDAALYSMAYADDLLNKYSQASYAINELLFKYQDTIWNDDAKTLFGQRPSGGGGGGGGGGAGAGAGVGVGSGTGGGRGYGVGASAGNSQSADDDPCEFKIVVLEALFRSDVQRGIAVATDWLKPGSTQTVRCKGAALKLLARYGGKSVIPVILGVAKNETDPKLRAIAISVLGATNDESVIDTLREFALSSPDTDISEAALYALSQHTSDRAMGVLGEIATSSSRPVPLRKAAISSISGRPGEPAVDILLKIYDADQNIEIRKSVIGGFSRRKSERAGAKLLEIARGADNIELRKAAISAIARRSGEGAIDILLNLYDTEKNEDLKDQIINSLGGSNDPRVTRKLIEIAKNPQTPMERRKRAIGSLSRSKDPEVLKFLEDLLKQ
jgi:HEAT repeat protein